MNRSVHTALRLAAISFAALSANIAHANEQPELDSCIQRFIASTLSGYQGKITVRKEPPQIVLPLSASGSRQVVVYATGKEGANLGSAVCRIDHQGNVLSMTPASPTIRVSKTPGKPVLVAGSGE